MSFEFVDNNAGIGLSSRRRIRSHVAMGRNVGKKLVRPSRKKASAMRVKTAIDLVNISVPAESDHKLDSRRKTTFWPERQVGDGLSVLSFPEQLSPGSKSLVQRGMYADAEDPPALISVNDGF